LNGQQPESCSLLRQTLSVAVARRYVFRWEARTAGIKAPSGLEWRVAGQHAILPPGEDWSTGELALTTRESFADLELVYRRPVGEPRAEGNVELRHVRIEAAQ
jgi:hypothetical protein